jgi:hypothetical protein
VSAARRERGVALLIAIWALTLMSGLGLALVAAISSETLIAANFRVSSAVASAADAMTERALADLRFVTDWSDVLSGGARSSFTDGAPGGTRTLPDGSQVDLDKIRNLANCNTSAPCSAASMDAITAVRPWGANNPRWQLYAYGPLDGLLPSTRGASGAYGVVLVADDPSDSDGDPLRDNPDPTGSGAGVLSIRVEAFAPQSAHAVVELTVTHRPALRILSWRP